MAYFSTVGNEAQYQKYNNATSGLNATTTQAAIDEIADDAVLVNTDPVPTTVAMVAQYDQTPTPDCLVDEGSPGAGVGSDGDFFYSTDGVGGYTLWRKTSGVWSGISGVSFQYGTFNESTAIEEAEDNGILYSVLGTSSPITEYGDMLAVYEATVGYNTVEHGDILVWHGMAQAWLPTGVVMWENMPWVTLLDGSGAPTAATGGAGWFYADTTNQDLYGPATFDPSLLPAGVWDWGSPKSNTTFSWIGPTNESGDWYVWDEFDDGTSWVLFQKKTAHNYGDMLFWDGSTWVARTQKISADDVYADLTNINSSYGVDGVKTQLQNLFSNYAQAYNGGNHLFVETNVDGTYEVNPFDGNGFILTVTDDTEITFASAWDPESGLGTRFCELTLMIKQDSTGGWDTTFGANVYLSTWENPTALADHMNIAKAITWDGGTTWFVNIFGAYDLAP